MKKKSDAGEGGRVNRRASSFQIGIKKVPKSGKRVPNTDPKEESTRGSNKPDN